MSINKRTMEFKVIELTEYIPNMADGETIEHKELALAAFYDLKMSDGTTQRAYTVLGEMMKYDD